MSSVFEHHFVRLDSLGGKQLARISQLYILCHQGFVSREWQLSQRFVSLRLFVRSGLPCCPTEE